MNKNALLKGWTLSESFSFRGTEIKLKKINKEVVAFFGEHWLTFLAHI